jgi:hypothetical protein
MVPSRVVCGPVGAALSQGLRAINDQIGAADVAGEVGRKKKDRFRDLVRLALAAQRRQGGQHLGGPAALHRGMHFLPGLDGALRHFGSVEQAGVQLGDPFLGDDGPGAAPVDQNPVETDSAEPRRVTGDTELAFCADVSHSQQPVIRHRRAAEASLGHEAYRSAHPRHHRAVEVALPFAWTASKSVMRRFTSSAVRAPVSPPNWDF